MRRGGACSKEKLFHTGEEELPARLLEGLWKELLPLKWRDGGKSMCLFSSSIHMVWDHSVWKIKRKKIFFNKVWQKKKLIWSPNMKIFEMLFELFSSHQEHDNQFLYQLVNHFTHIIWHWGRQGIHRKNKCRSDVILSIRNLLDRE